MKQLLVCLLAATMVCSLSQCAKTGPQGPQGEQGPGGAAGKEGPAGAKGDKGDKGDKGVAGAKGDKGDQGDKGATGAKGDPGNANVKSTGWVTIPAAEWSYGYGAGDINLSQPGDLGSFYSSSGLSSVSEAVAKGGVVLVYARLASSPNSARQLPFRFKYTSSGYSGVVELRFAYGTTPNAAHWVEPGAVLVEGTWNSSSQIIRTNYLPTVSFCLITIPAGNISRRSAPPVDYSDYEAVKAYYHLPD